MVDFSRLFRTLSLSSALALFAVTVTAAGAAEDAFRSRVTLPVLKHPHAVIADDLRSSRSDRRGGRRRQHRRV
jgi:hypothetical protein